MRSFPAMSPVDNSPRSLDESNGFFSRQKLMTVVLLIASAISVYVCLLIFAPFITSIAWAVALAVVAHPIYSWIRGRVSSRGIAAALSVAAVAILLIAPAVFVIQAVAGQAAQGIDYLQKAVQSGQFAASLERIPHLQSAIQWIENRWNIAHEVQNLGAAVARQAPSIVVGSFWAATQLMITLYTLFFFFRDRREAMQWLRKLSPLSEREAADMFASVRDTIYGVVYGYLAVALIQGAMGGLIFWVLGLPAPLVWGAAMAVFAAVPVLGTPVIWAPTALFLALQGEWKSALILTGWGALAIGLIDNILYPTLVGNRLRLHTLPVFFSIFGGIMAFGMAGVVLGPVVLACTLALLEIWRSRTEHGRTAEEEVRQPAVVVQPTT